MAGSSHTDRERLALEMRVLARHFFEQALVESSVDRAFQRHVDCARGLLRVCDDLYDLESYARVVVVSTGKAAQSLVTSLQLAAGDRFEGIISSPASSGPQARGFRYFIGGHPFPDSESFAAASAILTSLNAQTAASLVIYMISGGGSSMVERPIDDQISLDDLTATYRVLVHSGAPIAEINAIRKHLSAVKGGRMAQAAYPAQQVSLLISDVPDASPDALASGPTMPDSASVDDCYAIAAKHAMVEQFPLSVRELFQQHALEETPKSDDPAFYRSRWWTLSSNASALAAAKAEAEKNNFLVEIDNSCDDWDYQRAAEYLVQRLRDLRTKSRRVCLLSGGEVTVKVIDGGVGGRNQQFALACAEQIAGEKITILSAGTDGVDGNSPAAGAVVDGTSLSRAEARSLDLHRHLTQFDAFPFFSSLGDAVVTGPTGNNLRDVRILLAY